MIQTPRKKILYIITQGEWGGAQRYIFDLATNLSNDFDITVAVGEPDGKRDLQERLKLRMKSEELKINIVQLKYLLRKISPYHDFRATCELRRLYRQLTPDIVHLNSTKAGILGSLAAATTYNLQPTTSTIYTVHGWVFNEPMPAWRKQLYFYLEKFAARWRDATIALSSADENQARDALLIPKNKLFTIPLGITPPNFVSRADARAELLTKLPFASLTKKYWLGSIANYYRTKGLDVLIESLAVQKEKLQDVLCLLIGEGSERRTLARLISNHHLEDTVYLVGATSEAARLLPAFDLFVLPSRKEGFPYVILEALAAGVPILATAVGGVPEMVANGENSWLVPPENSAELAIKLDHILQTRKSSPLAEAASKPIKFNQKSMLSETISLYQSLVKTE